MFRAEKRRVASRRPCIRGSVRPNQAEASDPTNIHFVSERIIQRERRWAIAATTAVRSGEYTHDPGKRSLMNEMGSSHTYTHNMVRKHVR